MIKLLKRAKRFTLLIEDSLIVIMLSGMILLAAGQILMRNLFDTGLFWADPALRMLVLWVAVAGAVAASRSDKHINIAVLDRFLAGRFRTAKDLLIHSFTAAICGVVAWQGLLFVRTSHEFGDVLLGQVPAWILQLVLPLGFGLICYRYTLFTVGDAGRLIRGAEPE